MEVSAYSDADWAHKRDNRRSTSGILVMVNKSPVLYKSKLPQSVALSTAEAEYIALSLCIQEIMCMKNLLEDLKIKINYPVVIYEDDQSAIAIAKNEGY